MLCFPNNQSKLSRRFWLICIPRGERDETLCRWSRTRCHSVYCLARRGRYMNMKLRLAVLVAASAASLLMPLAYSWANAEGKAEAEEQIRKVEEERRQAILRNDINAL